MMARAGAGQAAAAPKITSGIPGKSGGSLMTSLVQGQAGGGSVTDLVKREQGARDTNLKQMAKTGLKYAGLAGVAGMVTLGLARMNRGVVQAAESMVAWNGQIAAGLQTLEAERIQRKIELGTRTGAGVQRAAESQSRLEEATMPWQAAWTNVKTWVTSTASNVVASAAEALNEMPVVGALLDYLSNEGAKGEKLEHQKFLDRIAGDDHVAAMQRQLDKGKEPVAKDGKDVRRAVNPWAIGASAIVGGTFHVDK